MTKRQWRNKSRPEKREGCHIPVTLWKCLTCGKRLRGDARMWPHLERAQHGAASAVRLKWKSSHK